MTTSYEAGRQWAATAAKAELDIFAVAWKEQAHPNSFAWPYVVELANRRWQEVGGVPADLDVQQFVRGALDAPTVTKNTVQIRVTPIKRPSD